MNTIDKEIISFLDENKCKWSYFADFFFINKNEVKKIKDKIINFYGIEYRCDEMGNLFIRECRQ